MPFPFVYVCDLLEQAYRQCESGNKNLKQRVTDWFAEHRIQIDCSDTDASALLSTLLPEKRTDRVYGIQATSLSNIVGRALRLGQTRREELRRFEKPGSGMDLADCVGHAFKETPSPFFIANNVVTVEEIDAALNSLAAKCRFSSPTVRTSQTSLGNRDDILASLYIRLQATEAKWLTRLILKDYQPVVLDPGHVYHCYDTLLPKILRVQDNFSAALSLLQKLKQDTSFRDAAEARKQEELMQHLTPILGVKVGRQPWLKGRSISHCINMSRGRMSCEKKVDGEYCQIHVDLSKGYRCVQIFSKSGKDSTTDRAALHGAIRDSLGIGKSTCRLSKGCILEGELVVYSDKEKKILPFHKIRKYVSRSGSFLHTELDSQRHHYEHLMIVYFDALLIDGESLLGMRHSERFKRLTNLINCREGHAELVERQVICMNQPMAASHLRKAFARSITARDEGLVLKPDDPYFDFGLNRRSFSGCPIKLKKEYIGCFGDVGDFAVIAAGYDADKAKCYRLPNLKWTHFYLGCLNNKEDVQRWHSKPEFTVVHQVELTETLLKTVMAYGNPRALPFEDNDALILHIAPGVIQRKAPSVVFTDPLVFDIRCFSFDQVGNTGFWQPRFPQVSKVHFDRSLLDTMSFPELQAIAEDATKAPAMEDSQELLAWIAALEGADPRGVPVDAVSQSTNTSLLTPSLTSSARFSTSPAPSCPEISVMTRRSLPTLFDAPQSALGTRPTSSAPEGTNSKHMEQTAVNFAVQTSGASKRLQEQPTVSPRERKRPRLQSEPSAASRDSPTSQSRPPLADMSINQKTSPSHTSQAQSAVAGHTQTTTSPSRPPRLSLPRRSDQESIETATTQSAECCFRGTLPQPATHVCKYAGGNCILANYFAAILSPCIAQQALITETLLLAHGIRKWTTDIQEFASFDALPSSTVSRFSEHQTQQQQQQQRTYKVAFVEYKRREATKAFMRQLEEHPSYTPSGRRQWVVVYDWRVLKDITALEKVLKGSELEGGHPDLKRKWYVGLV